MSEEQSEFERLLDSFGNSKWNECHYDAIGFDKRFVKAEAKSQEYKSKLLALYTAATQLREQVRREAVEELLNEMAMINLYWYLFLDKSWTCGPASDVLPKTTRGKDTQSLLDYVGWKA